MYQWGVSPLRTNRQLGTGQASGGEAVFVRVEGGAPKRSKEVMEACGIILLPRGEEEISVGKESSGIPPRGWPDMVGGPESGTL